MKIKEQKRKLDFKDQKGLALLITLILSGVLLLISVAIIDITLKELIISSSGRESQVAFYGSNTGIECALYYDLNIENAFPPPGGSNGLDDVRCLKDVDSAVANDNNLCSGDCTAYVFNFHVGTGSPCGDVIITKTDEGGTIRTKIESRGYNICEENPPGSGIWIPSTASPRVLERGLEVNY